jgi:hypothetical protein
MRKSKSKPGALGSDPNVENKAAPEAELLSLRAALEPLVTPNQAIPPTIAQANVPAANPFADLANIRVDQTYASTPGIQTLRNIIPVRRPGKQEFFQVNPDPAYRLAAALLIDESDEDRVPYLLVGGIHTQLVGEYKLATLRLTIGLTSDVVSIWPVIIPGWNGERPNSWHLSAENAAVMAETQWVRMRPVKALGGYQLSVADGAFSKRQPVWPTEPFGELLQTAFNGKVIDNLQHPMIQRLFGHA